MGVSTDSSIAVGNLYNNIADFLIPVPAKYEDDMIEYMESLGLSFFPPWYDAEPEYWFVGIAIPDMTLTESNWIRWVAYVEEAHKKLRKIVGPDLKLELKSALDVW